MSDKKQQKIILPEKERRPAVNYGGKEWVQSYKCVTSDLDIVVRADWFRSRHQDSAIIYCTILAGDPHSPKTPLRGSGKAKYYQDAAFRDALCNGIGAACEVHISDDFDVREAIEVMARDMGYLKFRIIS